jgi:hypothetical protein
MRTKDKKGIGKREKGKSLQLVVFTIAYCLLPIASEAQCAMCRAALASEEGGVKAEAINDGIVYLMVIPYVLVAAAAYAIYKIKYSKKGD